jgi:hypothetical protein
MSQPFCPDSRRNGTFLQTPLIRLRTRRECSLPVSPRLPDQPLIYMQTIESKQSNSGGGGSLTFALR